MSSSNILRREVESITECAICMQTMTSPRILPCVHTFCLKCLEMYCKDCCDGKSFLCPTCRTEFVVPVGGLSSLNKNFFIDNLVSIQISMSGPLVCGKHSKKKFKFFCRDCKVFACTTCAIVDHSKHEVSEISTIAAEYKRCLSKDFDEVGKLMSNCDEQLDNINEHVKLFNNATAEVETEVNRRKEELMMQANQHCTHSLEDMNSHKLKIMTEFENIRDRLKEQKNNLLSCQKSLRSFGDFTTIIGDIDKQITDVDKQIESFADASTKAETRIKSKNKSFRRLIISQHASHVKHKLNGYKSKILSEFETRKTTVEMTRNDLLNFRTRCQEAFEMTNLIDSAHVANELMSRAKELKNTRLDVRCTTVPEVIFNIADRKTKGVIRTNIVGKISGECTKYSKNKSLLFIRS